MPVFLDAKLWAMSIMILLFFFACLKCSSFKKKQIQKIDKMSGEQFEKYLKDYFEKEEGYSASLTKRTGDFGADLVLKKGRSKTVVQVKRYTGNVGLSAVQEAVAAMKYYKAGKAMVITNSFFTKSAKELARANRVILWDRKIVIKKMTKS